MNERTMENPHATSLPLLDEVKLQARVLLPVIRALRERLGKQSADELVGTALRQWSRDLHRRIGEGKADSARALGRHLGRFASSHRQRRREREVA